MNHLHIHLLQFSLDRNDLNYQSSWLDFENILLMIIKLRSLLNQKFHQIKIVHNNFHNFNPIDSKLLLNKSLNNT